VFAPVVHRLHEVRPRSKSLNEAAGVVARNVAILELCPYHSAGDPGGRLCRLPSANAAREFVHSDLVTRARRREVLVIVTRAARRWGFGRTGQTFGNVLIRDRRRRSAAFTPDEAKAMVDRLLNSESVKEK
jgi:hypothetical protein